MPFMALAGQAALGTFQGLLNQKAQRAQSRAETAAAKKANIETWKNTGAAIGGINLQRTLARTKTAGERFAVRRQASDALGMSVVSAAASGTTGASTEAAKLDIQRQLQEADAAILQNHSTTELNLNLSLEDLMANAKASMRQGGRPAPSGLKGLGAAIMGGVIDAGMTYANKKFELS